MATAARCTPREGRAPNQCTNGTTEINCFPTSPNPSTRNPLLLSVQTIGRTQICDQCFTIFNQFYEILALIHTNLDWEILTVLVSNPLETRLKQFNYKNRTYVKKVLENAKVKNAILTYYFYQVRFCFKHEYSKIHRTILSDRGKAFLVFQIKRNKSISKSGDK